MSTKLTYTGAEVQELLDKIEKGDFDNAKTLEGHPASYFAIASEFTSLAESFATEQGRVDTLCGYFNNGSANDALSLGGQLPSYYATALQYEILQQTLTDFKSLFDSMFEKDSDGNIHAKLSLWSSGGITAGGVGSGGSGGGGISYNRLDSWSDYSADKSGWVLSALLGKDLDNRVSALANAGYITASYLAPYALRSEIPSLEPYFLSSNFTKSNIKATLGISDWALASVKPTYTASEVGALGVKDTAADASKLGGYLPTTYMRASGQYTDSLNDLTSLGIYRMSGTITDGPSGAGGYGNLMVIRSNSWDTLSQLYFNAYNNRVFVRSGITSNLTSKGWNTLAFTSDLPTKLSQLTDDVVAGKYLPLSGGTLTDALTVKGSGSPLTVHRTRPLASVVKFVNTDGNLGWLGVDIDKTAIFMEASGVINKLLHSGNYSDYALPKTGGIMAKNSYIDWGNTDGFEDYSAYSNGFKILGYNGGSDDYRGGIHVGVRYGWQLTRNASSEVFQIRNYSPSSASWGDWKTLAFTDSNVASATKLQTPRTIWGQSFDGTGDITGALTAPSITANSLTIGGATITYDSVNEALCINGNMYALGGVTAGGAGISAYTSLEARVARLEQQLNIS